MNFVEMASDRWDQLLEQLPSWPPTGLFLRERTVVIVDDFVVGSLRMDIGVDEDPRACFLMYRDPARVEERCPLCWHICTTCHLCHDRSKLRSLTVAELKQALEKDPLVGGVP